jgi:hypothetical protein
MKLAVLLCAVLLSSVAVDALSQTLSPDIRKRAEEFFRVLAEFDPAKPEPLNAFWRTAFTPDLQAQMPEEEHRSETANFLMDFGTLTLTKVEVLSGNRVALLIAGSNGPSTRIELTFEPSSPFRIKAIRGDDGDE